MTPPSDISYAEACETHLARLLSGAHMPTRLALNRDTLAAFPGVPAEEVRAFLSCKGLLGPQSDLASLLRRYVDTNPGAMNRPDAIRGLRIWLREHDCRPQTIQILRHLRRLGIKLGRDALPSDLIKQIDALFSENPCLLQHPVSFSGPGGLIAFARRHGIRADSNTLLAALETYPVQIARGRLCASNRLDKPTNQPLKALEMFCAGNPAQPLQVTGRDGVIAHLAQNGVSLSGRELAELIACTGRELTPWSRATREEITEALKSILGAAPWTGRPRQITGAGGLHARVLSFGLDCSADAVKRAYLKGGGKPQASVVRRSRRYMARLPAVLKAIAEADPEYFSKPVPVRGPGGLKERVWREGIRANHEVIRRYAEAAGIPLRKGNSTPSPVAA